MENDWPRYKKIKGVVFSRDSKDYFRFDMSHRITALLRGVNEIEHVWNHIFHEKAASHKSLRKGPYTCARKWASQWCDQKVPDHPVCTGSLAPVRTGYSETF